MMRHPSSSSLRKKTLTASEIGGEEERRVLCNSASWRGVRTFLPSSPLEPRASLLPTEPSVQHCRSAPSELLAPAPMAQWERGMSLDPKEQKEKDTVLQFGDKKISAHFEPILLLYGQGGCTVQQTTVASTKVTSASAAPGVPDPNGNVEGPPGGVGETTYAEWYSKVGSKPASQQHEEVPPQPPVQSRPPSTTPYVSYPNDPTGYYTLGGRHRQNSSSSNNKYATKY
uniref:ZM domain-containing protein n=2 Tax=Caenorhabditis tropicalis TaxID=1561998 RepID=A0A1I7UX55_9PELO